MSAPRPLVPDRVTFLAPFLDAGVLQAADVQVAATIGRLAPSAPDAVLLAVALAVRAVRTSHVCVVLDDVPDSLVVEQPAPDEAPVDLAALPWPDPAAWAAALRASELVRVEGGAAPVDPPGATIPPLVFDGRRVYLERYWRYERRVGDDLLARAAADHAAPPDAAEAERSTLFTQLFPAAAGDAGPDRQRQAAAAALARGLVVIAGGPGTGKTRTIARILAALFDDARGSGGTLEVALAAPTGKAAARMTEAVHAAVAEADLHDELATQLAAMQAVTIHRLLGPRDDTTFRHDRTNPLAADVVVVDEVSMVSLPLMAKLLDAVRPEARLLLVGDPYQLASIEAGAVLGDVAGRVPGERAGPLADSVVWLETVHRFAADSSIAALAAAVRAGDADRAVDVLRTATDEVLWLDPHDRAAVTRLEGELVDEAVEVVRAARTGAAETAVLAANAVKVLAATRLGPFGTYDWRERIERGVARAEPHARVGWRFYPGRPVIVTKNDYLNDLRNGDTGVVVDESEPGAPSGVAFPGPEGLRWFQPSQLASVETWWSMTIHKSQGSEYRHAVVSLPTNPSRILTRELLYTGITRARERLTVVATEEALRTAISRPVARASGLHDRLWPAG